MFITFLRFSTAGEQSGVCAWNVSTRVGRAKRAIISVHLCGFSCKHGERKQTIEARVAGEDKSTPDVNQIID